MKTKNLNTFESKQITKAFVIFFGLQYLSLLVFILIMLLI